MTDFMDTALNYQAGIRIAPDAKRWVITNGITQMRLCEVCRQPIYEGHIDCACPNNHPANCTRPTYNQLRNLLQTLLDRHEGKGASMMITSLSPTDVAEIKEALDWIGD